MHVMGKFSVYNMNMEEGRQWNGKVFEQMLKIPDMIYDIKTKRY